MASKGPRSKLDHDTRARRQKALEAPREPPRRRTHWDHVIEEMVWLSKDFESEKKWKLAQAKKVALRASKNLLDQATKGEKKVKEEEQRLRKIALSISKDVKKFWTKIEKLVLYKHQLELEERKKKTLDKQLDFLLGQTERYSTMLAENLVDAPFSLETHGRDSVMEQPCDAIKDGSEKDTHTDSMEIDADYSGQSQNELEDDEHTIEKDEALITEEEQKEELAALYDDVDLPLEELLKQYTKCKVSRDVTTEIDENASDSILKCEGQIKDSRNQVNGPVHEEGARVGESNGDCSYPDDSIAIKRLQSKLDSKPLALEKPLHSGFVDEKDDIDYVVVADEEMDDETTLSEEEELEKKESGNPGDEIKLLQQESEIPIEELLARYTKVDSASSSDDKEDFPTNQATESVISVSVIEDAKQDISIDDKQNLVTDHMDVKPDELSEDGRDSENIIADAAAAARSAQPTGNTFSTTKVRTKFPFLLKHPLREYQHIGLDWLVTMYEKRLNGILADEMGLGKTIMTISLLAHLACEKGIWGPHLIVVPTSVMLNWETEFLKWCPAFKILTYFGSAKERKHKRQGWLKPNSFHVCVTTYRLVIQDSKVFKRKKWKYLILDEAHLIKNWKSQRWQTLLNFNSKRRILLTGTPLQNDLMELWSLMHFLMPHIFQSHQEFKDWFSKPITGMVEGQDRVNKEVVDRLHNVLRPFILRRLKRDVEKQLPKKHEHAISCRLSKRQRNLYEDFIASSETQATLASANFFGMISVIMQLRKVCNHPDLFEGRPIVSSFDMAGIDMQLSSSVCTLLSMDPFSGVDLTGLNFVFTPLEFCMTSWELDEVGIISTPSCSPDGNELEAFDAVASASCYRLHEQRSRIQGTNIFEEINKALWEERVNQAKERAAAITWWNSIRCRKKPMYGTNLRDLVTVRHPVFDIHKQIENPSCYMKYSSKLADIILLPVARLQKMLDLVESFMFAIPAARAPTIVCWCRRGSSSCFLQPSYKEKCTEIFSPLLSPIRPTIVRRQLYFPDRRLIQYDCGKLQELAVLLRRLKSEGHRALIFTQMTKMLDILEAFINLYGYTYMRLDGSTQPEERQTLMQRFNTNPKFFLFILSTRSGGVGINLVGADTVIFYDSDWNPAMDQQAQDRCHRIGQTREVHIYRLISESTIEENILKKANQKRALDDLVIQSGSYNTEFFKKLDPMELISGHQALPVEKLQKESTSVIEDSEDGMGVLSNDDVEAALKQAEDEADYMALKRVELEEAVENQEFSEEAVGRLEDDELANEDDGKLDEKPTEEQKCCTSIIVKDNDVAMFGGEKACMLAGREEDIDMLADVKQMAAAAAAAGQASSSFENQLRPIDRYAMRFLDIWDPVVDKSETEVLVSAEEAEWELDRIEKFKEDLEAEIDEDEEPFLYERWDADFATEAYRQQVEVLAQRQLMEELQNEAQEAKVTNDGCFQAVRNGAIVEQKAKSKKNLKKTKFKSLKKGSLASELDLLREEMASGHMDVEDSVLSPEIIYLDSQPHSPVKKKRKKALKTLDEETASRKCFKKFKMAPESIFSLDRNFSEKQPVEATYLKYGEGVSDREHKPPSRSKMGGKISITAMPVKRIMVVKPEKLKRRGTVWSKDIIPSPDSWSSQEDAILCATVHEYGTHWSLVSDILYGTPAGGSYRGRFRHPVHCCERFRELFFKYVSSAADNSSSEKISVSVYGKALLKVTEDHVGMLVNVTSELPVAELLIQKHFTALLSSVWRAKCRCDFIQSLPSSQNGLHSRRNVLSDLFGKKPRRLTGEMDSLLRQSSKLVAAALSDVDTQRPGEVPPEFSSQQDVLTVVDQVDITLEFPADVVELFPTLPSSISLSIYDPEAPHLTDENYTLNFLQESSCNIAQHRSRLAAEACIDGEGSRWASSAFPTSDGVRFRSSSKPQLLGKHKPLFDSLKPPKSKVSRILEPNEEPSLPGKPALPSPSPSSSTVDIHDSCFTMATDYEEADFSDTHLLLLDLLDIEYVPHDCDPNFIAGLENLDSLPEFIDMG